MSNYPEHFGLKQRVFTRDKQVFLYITDQMRQAEQEFRTAFDESDCVLTVSGPIGSGKTTVVNHAVAGLPGKTRVIRLGRVRLAPDEVLELLLTELGIGEAPSGTIRKLGALGDKVARLKDDDTRLVVVVEDASRTGIDTLGELEVICGSDGGFDIGLVVCGDETLPKLLQDERLRRLAQRVSASVVVAPLAVDEMEDYLLSAIREAGGDPSRILSNDVPALLHILSCGIPRLANKLVDAALKKVAAQSGPRVTCALLADIAETQFGITTEIPVKRRTPPVNAKVATPAPNVSAGTSANSNTSDGHATRVDHDTRKDVPTAAALDKPEPVVKPGAKPSVRAGSEPASLKATAPAAADGVSRAKPDADARPTLEPTKDTVKPDDDLPYLIQDTQPELAALKPESVASDPSFASEPEHEMLPDLDELAAELAASNPAPPSAAGIPNLSNIPELPVEAPADDPAPDARARETGRTEKAPAAAEMTDPLDAASVAEPRVLEAKDDAKRPATMDKPKEQEPEAKPKVPELKIDSGVTGMDAEPALPAADVEHEAPAAKADPELPEVDAELPEVQAAVPELTVDSAPTPKQRSAIPEATPHEAELISALADEHATSQQDDLPEQATDRTVDTTPRSASTVEKAPLQAKSTTDVADTPTAANAQPDVTAPKKDAIVVPEPELETVARVDDEAANGDQDPSLKLEVLDDNANKPAAQKMEGEVVIHDADRDPTLAQLKPDLDALELALAENFVPEGSKKKGKDDEPASNEPVPEITLDNSIEKKVSAEAEELAKRDAEIAARKKAADQKASAKSRPGPSDTDVHKLAAELKRANTLEDMDDRLAETLFGDEINMVAAQVLESAREQAENTNQAETPKATAPAAPAAGDDAKLRKQFEEVWGEVPDESETIDLNSVKPNSGLDMSASQRLATVRALNAGMGTPPPPPAKKTPTKPKDAPVPIEDQIDISMTNTMKALNIDPKVLEQPPETDESPKGGFFSRFRKKG